MATKTVWGASSLCGREGIVLEVLLLFNVPVVRASVGRLADADSRQHPDLHEAPVSITEVFRHLKT